MTNGKLGERNGDGALRGVVYICRTDGHRTSYLDTLSRLFSLAPVSGDISVRRLLQLTTAARLLCGTLDDDIFWFSVIALMRAILGRSTVGLFLRAQKCFEDGKWYYRPKKILFQWLRKVPRLTIVTITTFKVAPHFAEVAHLGLPDPQYWDLVDGSALRLPGNSELSSVVRQAAGDRKIICALGVLSEDKGLGFLTATLENDPRLANEILFVAAGPVNPADRDIADRLVQAGGLVFDRVFSDDEIVSAYGVSDAIWACYAPSFDQASGIFGRATQYGLPCVVRQSSSIHRHALAEHCEHFAVPFGDSETLAEVFRRAPRSKIDPITSAAAAIALKRQFSEGVGRALDGNR